MRFALQDTVITRHVRAVASVFVALKQQISCLDAELSRLFPALEEGAADGRVLQPEFCRCGKCGGLMDLKVYFTSCLCKLLLSEQTSRGLAEAAV